MARILRAEGPGQEVVETSAVAPRVCRSLSQRACGAVECGTCRVCLGRAQYEHILRLATRELHRFATIPVAAWTQHL